MIAVPGRGAAGVDSPHLESNMPTLLPGRRRLSQESDNIDREVISNHDNLV